MVVSLTLICTLSPAGVYRYSMRDIPLGVAQIPHDSEEHANARALLTRMGYCQVHAAQLKP